MDISRLSFLKSSLESSCNLLEVYFTYNGHTQEIKALLQHIQTITEVQKELLTLLLDEEVNKING